MRSLWPSVVAQPISRCHASASTPYRRSRGTASIAVNQSLERAKLGDCWYSQLARMRWRPWRAAASKSSAKRERRSIR